MIYELLHIINYLHENVYWSLSLVKFSRYLFIGRGFYGQAVHVCIGRAGISGLPAGLTDVLKAALCAVWTAGDAHCPSVVHESVAESVTFLRRNDLPQLFFHLGRFLDVINKTDQVAEPDAVSIRDDRRLAIDIAQHKIGTLSAYSRKLQ